jgi:tetratricopeptide (TPR) repeat protein
MIESGDRRGEVLYRYGRALSVMNNRGGAVWALDAARDDPEWFVPASYELAEGAFRSANFDLALQVLERLKTERTDSPDEDVTARILEIRSLLKTRRFYDEALELAELLSEDEPELEEATRLRAAALLGIGETDEAYDLIREADIPSDELESNDSAETEGRIASEGPDELEAAPILDLAEVSSGEDEPSAELDADETRLYWCAVRATFKREAKQLEEAREIVDACLADHPSDLPILNEALKVYAGLEDYTAVLAALRTAYEDQPHDRNLRQSLIKHLRSVGLAGEADEVLNEALADALDSDPPAPIQAAEIHVELAQTYIGRDRLEQGLDAYRAAFELLGDNAAHQLRFRFADALILAEQWDEALEIADTTEVEVYAPMIRGRVAFERGDYELALSELNRAALIWPDHAATRYYLARASEGVGDLDRAVAEYRQALRSEPGLAAPRERLVRLHLAEDRVRDAEFIYWFQSPKKENKEPSIPLKLLAIEIDARLGKEPDLSIPANADLSVREIQKSATTALGRGLRLRDGPAAAAEMIGELARQVEPSARDLFIAEQASLLMDYADDPEAALEVARKGIAELPGRPVLAAALGRALVAKGVETEEAQRSLERARALEPENVEVLATLGELALLRGDQEAALGRFDEALEISPDHWRSASKRFDVLLALGRRDEAIATLDAFLNRGNPYDGRAALQLAQFFVDEDIEKERRLQLAKRAARFSNDPRARELLEELDPEGTTAASPPAAAEPAAS